MGSYQMDYLTNSNWYGLLAVQYNRAFEKDKEDFSNKGFVHLRTARPILTHTDIEGFIQKEANHYIDLENRELLGAGLRINQFGDLYLGVGIMHEIEKYNNIPILTICYSTQLFAHYKGANIIKSQNQP